MQNFSVSHPLRDARNNLALPPIRGRLHNGAVKRKATLKRSAKGDARSWESLFRSTGAHCCQKARLLTGIFQRARSPFITALIISWATMLASWTPTVLAAVSHPDPRDFANGRLIPDEDYCDQPRIVVTHDGTWVCLMTTGPGREGAGGQHVVATRSTDQGKTWFPRVDVEPGQEPKSAYALALVTPQDRIYAFYCYNGDRIRTLPNGKPIRDDMQGWFCYRYSDDQGRTWSPRYRLPMRLTAADRNNDWHGKLQMFWAIGTPAIFGNTAMFGFTKLGQYILQDGEGWFYRSDNILTETDPAKLQWELLPDGDHGVRAPEFGSVQEEFDVVHLAGDGLVLRLSHHARACRVFLQSQRRSYVGKA